MENTYVFKNIDNYGFVVQHKMYFVHSTPARGVVTNSN